jgi:hypothetical protein
MAGGKAGMGNATEIRLTSRALPGKYSRHDLGQAATGTIRSRGRGRLPKTLYMFSQFKKPIPIPIPTPTPKAFAFGVNLMDMYTNIDIISKPNVYDMYVFIECRQTIQYAGYRICPMPGAGALEGQ